MPRRRSEDAPRRKIIPLAIAGWLIAATAGMGALWAYENGPGDAAVAPRRWPVESALSMPGSHARLVVVAHPKCPCTRATLRELERLMAENDGRLETDILFTMPRGAQASDFQTDLYERASRIPNVRVHRDESGAETRLFGAATSGQTLLYDRHGTLLFAGGITPGRGHEGDNAGRSAIYRHLRDDGDAATTASVFGCGLHDPGTAS